MKPKTKPFNLEAALRGEPLITRGGTPAKLLAYDPSLKTVEKIIANVGGWAVHYCDNGRYFPKGGDISLDMQLDMQLDSSHDLLMLVPTTKRTVWLNVYPDTMNSTGAGGYYYFSKKDAELCVSIGGQTIPVEIEVEA